MSPEQELSQQEDAYQTLVATEQSSSSSSCQTQIPGKLQVKQFRLWQSPNICQRSPKLLKVLRWLKSPIQSSGPVVLQRHHTWQIKTPTYSAGVKTDDKSNGMMCIGEKNRHIQQTESVSGTKNVFENDVRQNRADKSAVHDIAKDIKLNYQVKTCAFILRLKKHLRDGMNGYKMEITVGELDKMLTTCYGDPSLKTADLMLRKRACLHKITGQVWKTVYKK